MLIYFIGGWYFGPNKMFNFIKYFIDLEYWVTLVPGDHSEFKKGKSLTTRNVTGH